MCMSKHMSAHRRKAWRQPSVAPELSRTRARGVGRVSLHISTCTHKHMSTPMSRLASMRIHAADRSGTCLLYRHVCGHVSRPVCGHVYGCVSGHVYRCGTCSLTARVRRRWKAMLPFSSFRTRLQPRRPYAACTHATRARARARTHLCRYLRQALGKERTFVVDVEMEHFSNSSAATLRTCMVTRMLMLMYPHISTHMHAYMPAHVPVHMSARMPLHMLVRRQDTH